MSPFILILYRQSITEIQTKLMKRMAEKRKPQYISWKNSPMQQNRALMLFSHRYELFGQS